MGHQMSQRRQPVQSRSRETVARLLRAAEQLIEAEGPDALTTTAVAERAGVSPASLYRFFAGRDELIDALLIELLADLERHAEEHESTWKIASIGDYVDRELDLHVAYYELHPSLGRLWFRGRVSPAVSAAVHVRNRTLATRGRDALVAAGLLSADVPERAFVLLVEIGDRVLELAFREGPKADRGLVELGRAALRSYLEQLAAGSASPG
jgi:AcrR family transcriptional regulator